MAKKNILSEQDHTRIAEAVGLAETQTSGEIYCVIARQSDDYFFPSAFFSALAVLVAMVPAAYLIDRSWETPHPAILPLAGLAALATALVALWLAPGLRLYLVPRTLRYRRASAKAVSQFLSHNIHTTNERTGVLIFVSLRERYAEIVADSGINRMVEQSVWNGVIEALTAAARQDRLVEGYLDAIQTVGKELARHFPVGPDDHNELDDRLVEI